MTIILINLSDRPNKFIPNDWFSERIILLNKKNICPSANAKINEFLRKMVALNVWSLWSYKKAVLQAKSTTLHGNCHLFIVKLPDVSLLFKHIINNSIFKKKLGHTDILNNTFISIFFDLFYIRAPISQTVLP